MHLDLEDAVAAACFAASALDIEAEPPGLVAAHLRFARLAEEVADGIEYARVGRGVRARRAPDGLLVDVDDLVDVLEPPDGLVLARLPLRVVEARGDALVEDLVDERRFAGARDSGHERERAEREFHAEILEVVLLRTDDLEEFPVAGPPLRGHGDVAAAREICARNGCRHLLDFLGRPLRDDVAALRARARADVDDAVRRAHGVLVMLDDDERIAEVAQFLERREQAVVVALMQADARLIEHIEHAREPRADLCGEPDALRLAARERPRRA